MWLKIVSFRCLTGRKNKPRDTRRSGRESQGFRRRNVGAEGYALGIKVLGAILAFLYVSATSGAELWEAGDVSVKCLR